MTTNNLISEAVLAEQARQIELWGEQNHPDGTSVDNREIADLARQSCEQAFASDDGSWFHILLEEVMEAGAEEDEAALVSELIQVAAVAQSWVAAIGRRQELKARAKMKAVAS